MPSVYSYRHVELDNVGRGKRVIKPPGGETADIFGAREAEKSSYSSAASSQAGSDVASARMHLEADQQSVGGQSSVVVDGIAKQQPMSGGQVSPASSSVSTSAAGQPQPLLMAEDFKPVSNLQQQPQQLQNLQQQHEAANRTPKKTIPTIRRNPITGEIYDAPAQQMPVRVRQPPGGKSSGIF